MEKRDYILVTFHSPGSFFNESSSQEFDMVDIKEFCKKATKIKERYGASPFGFSYQKMSAPLKSNIDGFEILPKKIGKPSGMFFINGEVIFHENLNAEDERILRSNLEYNSDGVGVVTQNSYKHHAMFDVEDVIVDTKGNIIRKGTDEDIVAYRKKVRNSRN